VGRVLRRWAWIIILFGVIAAVTTAAVSLELPKTYEAHARGLVNPKQAGLNGSVTPADQNAGAALSTDELVATYVELINSDTVNQQLVQDKVTQGRLTSAITAKAKTGTTVIDITVQDSDPNVAQRVAADIIPAFNRSLDQLQAQVQPSGTAGNRLEALVPWQVPTVAPTTPVSPRPLFNTAIALLAGLGIGVALAFVFDYLDNTLKNEYDVMLRLKLPLLGPVLLQPKAQATKNHPEGVALVTLTHPKSPVSEGFRAIRTNLLFSSVEGGLRSLVVTSAIPGEGKTSIACNIAVTLAQAGNRVILVDADFRRPNLHKIFHLMQNVGLGNMILGNLPEQDLIHKTQIPNLAVVCSGPSPSNPSELLGSSRMTQVVERLKQLADVVVFDSPPVGAVTDATVLAARLDGVVLVVERGRASIPTIERTRTRLDAVGARVLGVVLNKVKASESAEYYYYRYYERGADKNGGGKRGRSLEATIPGVAAKPTASPPASREPVGGRPPTTSPVIPPVTSAPATGGPTVPDAPPAQLDSAVHQHPEQDGE
jgi:capsular exopolysaccharide synthesis family protein